MYEYTFNIPFNAHSNYFIYLEEQKDGNVIAEFSPFFFSYDSLFLLFKKLPESLMATILASIRDKPDVE